ncbi:esterase-like activity of phytase family protein [Teredinibacter turnerae]|uniref:esterase-like activity of phytase family protein n=1 Tax=Teredinibacter turnerae TaxID=2426 RepID=UPI0030CEE808
MDKTSLFKMLALSAVIGLSACSGDDGKDGVDGTNGVNGTNGTNGTDGTNGTNGTNGSNGTNGLNSLVAFTNLSAGDDMCFKGGVRIDGGLDANGDGMLAASEITDTSYNCTPTAINSAKNFNRIASFPVCSQIDPSCDDDTATAAEIVAASSDGMTLVYTDSPNESIGFVDITNPAMPVAAGTLKLSGEPTSVAVKGDYALVAVNESADYVNVGGSLQVINIATQTLVRTMDLGGQPDSIAVSPDKAFAGVVIENERDEDLGDGKPPQLPAGGFFSVNIADADPANWSLTAVNLEGVATLFPADPEPEYVDINAANMAVVTLQENNHIALIDLATATVVNDFSAGTVDLSMIDVVEEEPAVIDLSGSLADVPREPDGVTWINTEYFATADEGDMDGGSRGFTVFNLQGDVVWNSGSTLDHMAVRFGQYPDARSENKGNEPENIELGIFGSDRYLFVNSERSSMVFVYDVANPTAPVFKQVLPAGVAPEGGLAIPSRNLLVVASEEDSRDDKIRSVVNIYQYNSLPASYPTVQSADRFDGTPIPWSAMSGLAADPSNESLLYAIEDSFYASNRIFTLDVSQKPAVLMGETHIVDSNGVFAAFTTSGNDADADSFDAQDLAAMINGNGTVNIDPEGITVAADGGFWVASEGAGTVTETDDRPIESLNFLLKTTAAGVIEKVVTLPASVNANQVRFGFEGVAEYNGKLYVAMQRAWGADANPRIGIYDIDADSWSFVFYPLDARESQNKGWVGLSDISSLGNGEFLLVERDNQGGPDAAIKRLYKVDLSAPVADSTITKTLVRDLVAAGDLTATGGLIPEKIEGSAVMANGDVYIINDNDGVDDNSGETQLINLGSILNHF